MKRILLILLGIIVLGVAVGGLVISRLDSETLRLKVADMTREATGKAVYMDAAPSLSFMPLGISVGRASWGYEGGKPATSGLSVEVKGAVVRLELMPLLSGRVVVREVRLDSPKVTVRPEQAEQAGKASEAGQSGGQATGQAGATKPHSGIMPLELEQLNISNGSLTLEHEAGQVVRVDALNAAISNLKTGAEATIKLDMGIACANPDIIANFSLAGHVRLSPGAQGDTVSLRQTRLSFTPLGGLVPAALGPIQMSVDGSYALASGKAQLEALKISLQGLELEALGQAMTVSPAFSGSLKVQAEPAVLARHLGITLPPVPGTGKVQWQCAVEADTKSVKVTRLSGDADGVSLSGDMTLKMGAVPTVLASLKVGHVNLDAAGQKASAKAAGGEIAAADKGKSAAAAGVGKNAAAIDKTASAGRTANKSPVTIYPRLDLDINVASLTASKVKLENIHAVVRGEGGKSTEYAVEPLELRLATGGSLHTTARVALPSMNAAAAGKISGVAVGPLMQSLNGTRPLDGMADAEYALSCTGSSAAAIKASLSGKGSLTVTNIDLKGVSLLPKTVPVQGGVPTHFDRLYVPFTAQKGVVTISGMTLMGAGLNAQGKGVVRLPQETVNMTANVGVLGTQIPVTVSGPFSNLSYGVDPKWAARTAFKAGEVLLQGGKKTGGGALDVVEGAGGLVKGLFGR